MSVGEWLLCAAALSQPHAPIRTVAGFATTVMDMDRALEFYTRVLPFSVVSDRQYCGETAARLLGVSNARVRAVELRLSEDSLYLIDFIEPESRPFPDDARANDRSFQHVAIVVSDMDAAYRRLLAADVRHASLAPQRLPMSIPAAAGIEAFYFRDPDGHWLELIQFPADKGDVRWQSRDGELFLGIDHSAIVVEDTEESLAFYRDRLGLSVHGKSENFGVEQERLNGVFGCFVRITGLRAESGPGIELLDYLAPSEGKPVPHDHRASDLAHWWIVAVSDHSDVVLEAARRHRPRLVSPGLLAFDQAFAWRRGLTLRDPDGHGLLVLEAREEAGDGP